MNSKRLPVQLSHRESVILCRCLDVFWINHMTITCTNRAPLFLQSNDDSSFYSKINENNVHWIVQAMASTKSGTPSPYPHTSSTFWKIYSGRILKETLIFLSFFFCVLFVLYDVMIEYLYGRSAQQINTLPPSNEVIFCNVFLVPVENTSSWVYWISSPNPSIFIATMKT